MAGQQQGDSGCDRVGGLPEANRREEERLALKPAYRDQRLPGPYRSQRPLAYEPSGANRLLAAGGDAQIEHSASERLADAKYH